MTDLHLQLLARTRPLVGAPGRFGVMAKQARAALRAVVELHAPRPCRRMDGDLCMHLDQHNVCTTCGPSEPYVIGDPDSTARCSTILAIARELGIEATDRG